MARYYSDADYCAEEMRRPYANSGQYCHGEGGESYAVRKEAYEEIDEVERARRGYGHGHHGHLGHSGSSHHGHLGHCGSHREHHHGHGHDHGGRLCDPCESKYDSHSVDQYYG